MANARQVWPRQITSKGTASPASRRSALAHRGMRRTAAGASLAIESSSLFTPDGPPPRLGQSFLVMDPAATAGADFVERVEHLLAFITGQPGARLPGDRRIGLSQSARQSNSIDLPDDLLAQLRGMC